MATKHYDTLTGNIQLSSGSVSFTSFDTSNNTGGLTAWVATLYFTPNTPSTYYRSLNGPKINTTDNGGAKNVYNFNIPCSINYMGSVSATANVDITYTTSMLTATTIDGSSRQMSPLTFRLKSITIPGVSTVQFNVNSGTMKLNKGYVDITNPPTALSAGTAVSA